MSRNAGTQETFRSERDMPMPCRRCLWKRFLSMSVAWFPLLPKAKRALSISMPGASDY